MGIFFFFIHLFKLKNVELYDIIVFEGYLKLNSNFNERYDNYE